MRFLLQVFVTLALLFSFEIASALLEPASLATAPASPDASKSAAFKALEIPAAKYQFVKGDDDCDRPDVELNYSEDGAERSVTLGTSYRFPDFTTASSTENLQLGKNDDCKIVTTNKIATKNVESRIVETCKDKTHNFDQTKNLSFDGIKLVYSMTRKFTGAPKPISLKCEYQSKLEKTL